MSNLYLKYFNLKNIVEEIKKYSPSFNEKKFMEAFEFAVKAHEGQMRKDNKTPYITHPIKVVEILMGLHADEDTLISTILHDVPEDTEYTIMDVKKRFGDKVAFLVDGVTKLSKVYYRDNMPERQIESLRKLFLHSSSDFRVILIKLADRLHNMQTLQYLDKEEKKFRIARETLEVYVPIANLLGIQEIKYQLEDLCFKYLFPPEYNQILEKRKVTEKIRHKNAQILINGFHEFCIQNKIKADISERKKNLFSVYKKICSLSKTIEEIDDRLGIRIIVDSIDNCYRVLGLLHSKYLPKNDRFRDYIANPKANGYQSLHTSIFGPGGALAEVQIRTPQMHIESEYGIASGFFASSNKEIDKKRIAWVAKILELEKSEKDSDRFMENLKLDVLKDRIFVFSPKGEPIDLPEGAVALDFAFAIHSELGSHAFKANINGKMKNINSQLNSGDIVEIVTSNKVSPDIAWLSFIKTNLARNKILAYLKKFSNEKKLKEGKKILQKEFDIAGLGLYKNMNYKKICKCINCHFDKKYSDMHDVLRSIGTGELKSSDVVKFIQNNYRDLGHNSKNSDINCGKNLRAQIKIVAHNRFGLLRDISEVLYNNVLDLYALKGWASKYEKEAYFTADILVGDFTTLSQIFNQLEQIDDVVYVYRFSRSGVLLITFGSIFTIMFWIFHPFILHRWVPLLFQTKNNFIANMLIYGGLFILVAAVLWISSIFRKYFPYLRRKKLIWVVSFLVPILAGASLGIELIYFKLYLSFWAIFFEVLLIYIYLLYSFIGFNKAIGRT